MCEYGRYGYGESQTTQVLSSEVGGSRVGAVGDRASSAFPLFLLQSSNWRRLSFILYRLSLLALERLAPLASCHS